MFKFSLILKKCNQKFLTCKRFSSSIQFTGTIENKLNEMKLQHITLAKKLESPELSVDELTQTSKAYANLEKSVLLILERDRLKSNISSVEEMIQQEKQKGHYERDLMDMAVEELQDLTNKLNETEENIIKILTPADDADDRGVILEVRAGTGGDEASLFSSELFNMYQGYAECMGWKWEELSLTKTDIGGFKEAQAHISGEEVFKKLKFESGVHRVQRIPVNSKSIQTSAAIVIVMPEAEEVDVNIRPQDLRIDVFRAGGAGGQSVNKTESAVRITHLPTGCTVSMQDERSQIMNRAKAMKIIRSRVYDIERRRLQASRNEQRHAINASGDRSDKIRTYNFPQDRVSDHRVNFTANGVDRFMEGESLDTLIQILVANDEKERLETFLKKLLDDNLHKK